MHYAKYLVLMANSPLGGRKYNKDFNNINLFDNSELLNTFVDYGMQDSVALYNALVNAQSKIFHSILNLILLTEILYQLQV